MGFDKFALVYGQPWTIVLSMVALILTSLTISGCSYVNLRFAAENDRGIFFPNDEFFGIGINKHQDYITNKSSTIWEHDFTCMDYSNTDLIKEFGSFMDGVNVYGMAAVATSAIAFMLIILAYTFDKLKGQKQIMLRVVVYFCSLASAIVHVVLFVKVTATTNGGVCDPSSYEDWYSLYDMYEFPTLRYFNYFDKCTLGSTGKISIAAIVFQFLTSLWVLFNLALISRTSNKSKNIEHYDEGDFKPVETMEPAVYQQSPAHVDVVAENTDVEAGACASDSNDGPVSPASAASMDKMVDNPPDTFKEEPMVEKAAEEPMAEETAEEPMAEETAEEPMAEETVEEPMAEEAAEEPMVEETVEESMAEEAAVEPMAKESFADDDISFAKESENEDEGKDDDLSVNSTPQEADMITEAPGRVIKSSMSGRF